MPEHHHEHILLKVNDLEIKTKVGKTLVRGISFEVGHGEIVGLCGDSGSGKSLTSLAVIGHLPIDLVQSQGTITWQIQPEHQGRKVSAIFQDPMAALNPLMRCKQQITEALLASDASTQEAQCAALCADVQFPVALLDRYPHQLSGGQRQRLVIAIALAVQPALLIADEPSTALDPILQKQVLDLLSRLCRERNMALLLISHDARLMAKYADRFMQFADPQPKSATQLEQLNLPKQHTQTAHEQVVVQGLSLAYPRTGFRLFGARTLPATLKNLHFSIQKGEILVVIGPSGSGKSSLARSLCLPNGHVSGTVQIDGETCQLHMGHTVHPRIQMVWQDAFSSLNPRTTIGNLLAEVAKQHQQSQEVLLQWCAAVRLPESVLESYPHQLSGGQRQRVAIVRALLARPSLLICDEITASVDAATEVEILGLMRSLAADHGLALMFITHQMHIVKQIAQRVMVLKDGEIVASGATDSAELLENEVFMAFM
jgi:ABC-type glutathione transport system ATPase component